MMPPKEIRPISRKDLIAAPKVMELWSLSDVELFEEIQRGELAVFFCNRRSRTSPDGEELLMCWEGTFDDIPEYDIYEDELSLDCSSSYFRISSICAHQKQYPHLGFPTTNRPTADDTFLLNFQSTAPEWMPAHEARVVLAMTPIEFVNLLNSGALETNLEQERLDSAEMGGWEKGYVPFLKQKT
ncbi:hypothetical protein [Desulfovibrio inopinatus]|uniref:hypothetical protein n=1 Tax=Desulfovibrio inopinatus TaxID=102109 RepID=UPI0004874889|nr:hypothetical protein [Desulfovibrio inopinatus]